MCGIAAVLKPLDLDLPLLAVRDAAEVAAHRGDCGWGSSGWEGRRRRGSPRGLRGEWSPASAEDACGVCGRSVELGQELFWRFVSIAGSRYSTSNEAPF